MAPSTPPADWFRVIWDDLDDLGRDPIRAKAQHEYLSLRAVMIDWPSLVPKRLRHLVPKPERAP